MSISKHADLSQPGYTRTQKPGTQQGYPQVAPVCLQQRMEPAQWLENQRVKFPVLPPDK